MPWFIYIGIFPIFFYTFLNEPGFSLMSVWCPDDNLNCFSLDVNDILYKYHSRQDLNRDWISASYLIKYAHIGQSCEFEICNIPEVNISVTAFKLGMLRNIRDTPDISYRFCQIPICVDFLGIVYTSPNEPVARPELFGIWTITQIMFYWISTMHVICILSFEIFNWI